MSHMTKIRAKIKSKEGIVWALSQCGFKETQIEVHDTPQVMYGYDGAERPTKAEIIVRRKFVGGSSNDLGFQQQPDGTWDMIISDYDRRGRYGPLWQNKILQEVGRHTVNRQMTAQGFRVEWVQQKNGTLDFVALQG